VGVAGGGRTWWAHVGAGFALPARSQETGWLRGVRLPSHRQVMRLVAVEAEGERVLGEYTFNHSAWVG